jgi:hypothetical protein
MVSGELLTLHTAASLHCDAPRTVAVLTRMLMKGYGEQGTFLIHDILEVTYSLVKKKSLMQCFELAECPALYVYKIINKYKSIYIYIYKRAHTQ